MASSNPFSWSRYTSSATQNLPKPAEPRLPSHSRQESEVINATGVRHPSANHRPKPTASAPQSPTTLRTRSSPRDSLGQSFDKKTSSPNLTVPTRSYTSEEYKDERPQASGAERIIKGTSKWLRDKLDLGGERNEREDGWLMLDLPNTSFAQSFRSSVSSSKSLVVPTYDERGYPARESLDPPVGISADRHSSIERTPERSRAIATSSTKDTAFTSDISKSDNRTLLSDKNPSKKLPLGYSHHATLIPLSVQMPSTSSLDSIDSSFSPLADFGPDFRTLLNNASLGSGPRPGTSLAESAFSSLKTGSSVYSWHDSDGDSAARLRVDLELEKEIEKGHRKDRNPIMGLPKLGGFSRALDEKQKLYDLLPFHIDPSQWESLGPEDDDALHSPDLNDKSDKQYFSFRGLENLGCLFLLLVSLVVLFAGYPIVSYYSDKTSDTSGGYNLGGINATGQIPAIGNFFQVIDPDTPTSAYTWKSKETGEEWDLVFSDEFNAEGRTFSKGDDPFWEAVDLHYWETNNLEWYDPSMLTTKNGSLVITLTEIYNHGLNFEGGMMTSWNQFCFTGGYIEVSVSLPGVTDIAGLWPAVWTMGNLGRAGYGGTLDGTWPYTYDTCDVGTLPNQTLNGLPAAALTKGDPSYDNVLSYLPGQRLSRCSCPDDESHPGPKHSDGTFVGRAAPEIDIFEATVDSSIRKGQVSQSGQWAPFNTHYSFLNSSDEYYQIYNDSKTSLNSYMGSVYQQATSALSFTDQECYTGESGCFSTYGFEYATGEDGYITWVNDNEEIWTVRGAAMGPNDDAEVGQRLVSEEPMYIIFNLGLSENFGVIDYVALEKIWPVIMEIDYIRVYQDPSKRNIGCDPTDHPTADYIARFPDAYDNANITVFDDVPNKQVPRNRLVDEC